MRGMYLLLWDAAVFFLPGKMKTAIINLKVVLIRVLFLLTSLKLALLRMVMRINSGNYWTNGCSYAMMPSCVAIMHC